MGLSRGFSRPLRSAVAVGAALLLAGACAFHLESVASKGGGHDGGAGTGGEAGNVGWPDASAGSGGAGATGGAGGAGATGGSGATGGGAAGGSGGASCSAGHRDCNGIASDGCETNVLTDPKNCGTCGHDCLAGACKGGACQPVKVTDATSPWGIALDSLNVYFTTVSDSSQMGFVWQVAKGGTGLMELSDPNKPGDHAYDIAADNQSPGFVYFTQTIAQYGAVTASQKYDAGGGGHDTDDTLDYPKGLSLDANCIYFVNNDHTIRRVTQELVFSPPKVDLTTAATKAHACIVETAAGGNVYFTDEADGKLYSLPKAGDGGAIPTAISSGHAWAGPLAMDSANVYFGVGTAGNGDIRVVAKSTPTDSSIFKSPPSMNPPAYIAVDGTNVYWTDSAGGKVLRAAKSASGPPVTLVSGETKPEGIAVDNNYVYWAEHGNSANPGHIWKVAK